MPFFSRAETKQMLLHPRPSPPSQTTHLTEPPVAMIVFEDASSAPQSPKPIASISTFHPFMHKLSILMPSQYNRSWVSNHRMKGLGS